MAILIADILRDTGCRPRGIVHVGANKAGEMSRHLSLEPALIVWIEADPAHIPRLHQAVAAAGSEVRQIVQVEMSQLEIYAGAPWPTSSRRR